MAEAESEDILSAAADYGGQCIGADNLKDKQKSALVDFLRKKDVFVSLPTGYGKSAVFVDCLAVSVFFSLFSLQASVTVKNRGGAISNDRMVAPSHFGCKQRLLKLNHIRIP